MDWVRTLVAVLAPDGTTLFVNAALEDALGLSRRALRGADFCPLLADPAPLRQALAGVRAQDFAALHFTVELHGARGQLLPVQATASLHEPTGGVLLELWPLHAQARHEREEQLRAQGETHKELIRNLAHEIRNPLGGIRGAAQLLELELPAPALADYTRVIIREADRLQSLVDRLLEPHRHPQHMADVNIHEICEHVRDLVLAEHPRGLEVVRDYDASIPELRGDRDQLVQVVLNIVRNAAQALQARIAAGDARIELRTRVARQLTLGRQRHRLALLLDVVDNGPGVPPHLQERIFVPLVTGRAEGTGLGLTLAQAFVQRHGGIIECESRPGCTRFGVVLPLATSS
nr:nitrogen regulation protein NR(II) [Pulveribacter sp.]